MLDLLFCEIFGGIGLQWHAVIAHTLRPVGAHSRIAFARNLSIEFIKSIVERRLLDHFPWVLDQLWGASEGYRGQVRLFDRFTIQAGCACWSCRCTVRYYGLFLEGEEELCAMSKELLATKAV